MYWHCWNAGLIAHMCRLQLPSEAPCERWGSLLHNKYDPGQGIPPERSACRLFLKESGLQFVGAEQDESFVKAITQIFRDKNMWNEFSYFLRTLENAQMQGPTFPCPPR